jgi:hypothetical protein
MARSGGSHLDLWRSLRGEADMHGRVAMTAWVVGERSSGRFPERDLWNMRRERIGLTAA